MEDLRLYAELKDIFAKFDDKMKGLTKDMTMTKDEMNKSVFEIYELTVLDVRHHLDEFENELYGLDDEDEEID